MPYEYRRLTPEEREEVVRQRRERGYPLHSPPHPFRGELCYLISAANYEHKAIMASPERRTELEARLLEALATVHAEVIAWVVLPNHYHTLVNVESLASVSAALQRVHGSTSHAWNLADGMTGKRTVWLRFTDRAIRNDSHFEASFTYTSTPSSTVMSMMPMSGHGRVWSATWKHRAANGCAPGGAPTRQETWSAAGTTIEGYRPAANLGRSLGMVSRQA